MTKTTNQTNADAAKQFILYHGGDPDSFTDQERKCFASLLAVKDDCAAAISRAKTAAAVVKTLTAEIEALKEQYRHCHGNADPAGAAAAADALPDKKGQLAKAQADLSGLVDSITRIDADLPGKTGLAALRQEYRAAQQAAAVLAGRLALLEKAARDVEINRHNTKLIIKDLAGGGQLEV